VGCVRSVGWGRRVKRKRWGWEEDEE